MAMGGWGEALGGAGSGAATGASIGTLFGGPIGTGIGAGIGALAGGLGGWLFGGSQRETLGPQNWNPATDQQMARLLADKGSYENQMKQYLAKSSGYQGQMNDFLNKALAVQGPRAYDPGAANRAFLARAPELQNLVAGTRGDNIIKSEVDALKRQSMRDIAQSMSDVPVSSGAFAAALGEGMAGVNAQYAQQEQAQQNQMLQSLFLQEQQLASAQEQMRFEADLQLSQAAKEREMLGFTANATLSQMNDSIAQMFNANAMNTQQGITSLSQGVWAEPTIVEKPSDFLTGLSALGTGVQGIQNAMMLGDLRALLNPKGGTSTQGAGKSDWMARLGNALGATSGPRDSKSGNVSAPLPSIGIPDITSDFYTGQPYTPTPDYGLSASPTPYRQPFYQYGANPQMWNFPLLPTNPQYQPFSLYL